MTTTLLKYILQGALKGVEEYEALLDKEHIDSRGKLANILPPEVKSSEPEKIDLDDLFKEII